MTTILSKKDFKVIWISSKNPEKVIIELEQKTLDSLIGTKRRIIQKPEDMNLREYILSWEINNPKNISWVYNNMDDFILSLK
jgi:hypothetical protein